jgi:hypothetical protein
MNDLRDASLRKNVLSIEGIMNNMWKIFPKQLSKGRHEDIFEALDCLLDAMDNDLKNLDVVYKENNEQISDNFDCVFGGELRCVQSCPDSNCSYVSNKVERFLTVALPLGNVNNQVLIVLKMGLRSFVQKKYLVRRRIIIVMVVKGKE